MMDKADPVGARAWLRIIISGNKEAFEKFLNDQSDLREELLAQRFPYESGPLPPKFGGIASILLLNWAKTDIAGHSYLRKVLARLVRSGEPVPEIWRALHADIIEGAVKIPQAKGRRAVHNRRDELVSLLTSLLQHKFNLPLSANGLSRKGESAIEIVVNELAGLCPSIQMLELGSLEKAIQRRKQDKAADTILAILDVPT